MTCSEIVKVLDGKSLQAHDIALVIEANWPIIRAALLSYNPKPVDNSLARE